MSIPTSQLLSSLITLQVIAENQNIKGSETSSQLKTVLMEGNGHTTRLTASEADSVVTQMDSGGLEIVDRFVDDGSGFSGTLFKLNDEYVISFRSTEFLDDALRDTFETNNLEIKEGGWAYGQIASMEAWYASLKSAGTISATTPLTVTGYSLGGHLATVFYQLRDEESGLKHNPPNIKAVYTFNGAGVGKLNSGMSLTNVISQFREHAASTDDAYLTANLTTANAALVRAIAAEAAAHSSPNRPRSATRSWTSPSCRVDGSAATLTTSARAKHQKCPVEQFCN